MKLQKFIPWNSLSFKLLHGVLSQEFYIHLKNPYKCLMDVQENLEN